MLLWMRTGEQARDDLENGRVRLRDMTAHTRRCIDLALAVDEALAQAEVRDVVAIEKAAAGTDKSPPDWRAAAHMLERRNPERWGKREQVTLGGSVTVKSWLDLARLGEAGDG